jgi:hypothetical protein
MDKLTLARKIHQTSKVHGQFTLRSGQQAHEYFDKYLYKYLCQLPDSDHLGGTERNTH